LTDSNMNVLLKDYTFKAYGKQYTIPKGFKFD